MQKENSKPMTGLASPTADYQWHSKEEASSYQLQMLLILQLLIFINPNPTLHTGNF